LARRKAPSGIFNDIVQIVAAVLAVLLVAIAFWLFFLGGWEYLAAMIPQAIK
jgi:TRAP-type C4-dicarboxylate transport system permease small subunit